MAMNRLSSPIPTSKASSDVTFPLVRSKHWQAKSKDCGSIDQTIWPLMFLVTSFYVPRGTLVVAIKDREFQIFLGIHRERPA